MSETPGPSGEKKKQKTVSPAIEFLSMLRWNFMSVVIFIEKKKKNEDNWNELVLIRNI